ncbi:MAG TPA: dihydroorotase [Chitinophagales bacterium]|nr:dihydroorotase [Chitinophagales bacterium]
MEIILRAARIIDTGSPFHNQVKDILISGGRIKKIGAKLQNSTKAKEVKAENLHVSIGWFDLNTYLADPGFEQKETIESGCRAAAFGGFTHICCMPNTNPVLQTKSQVEYVLRKAGSNVVNVHPIGAVTHDTDGKDLADMYDMYQAGAVAFSDGPRPMPTAGIMERALLYIKAFDGLVMSHPEDKTIAKNGAMHEGITSTRMGLPGAPALAEEIAVNRDLYVLEYTDSKLHLLDISLKKSVEMVKAAKKKGLHITASANAYNLMLDESAVGDYNTNYKVNPHLRAKEDITALIKGIADGTIDTITSAHHPQEEDCKKLEFDKADFGMIGLETCFAVANTALKGKVETDKIVALLAQNPRKILGLEIPVIKEGVKADLTLFDPDKKWAFAESDIKSLSKNTPFVGTEFTGKALGVINNEKLFLQQ